MFALFESFRSALESIRAHGFRSLLTSLGIIIGVTSVIAVVSIVQGLSYTINAQFAGLGGNSLTIRSYTPFKKQIQGRLAKLRDSDYAGHFEAYRRNFRHHAGLVYPDRLRRAPSVIVHRCHFPAWLASAPVILMSTVFIPSRAAFLRLTMMNGAGWSVRSVLM